MEESTLYDVLNNGLLTRWREKIEETESDSWLFSSEQKALKTLEAELNDNNKELLTLYALAVDDKLDYIHSYLNIKILNLGIKIGMELQQAFTESEED